MPERVRVALIGAGRIGQRHAATLASAIPRAELAIIADVHGPSAATLAAKVRCQHWTDNPESVLADAAINAIVIASSTDSHAPLIVAAAEAGKQIFCEKPIALDLEATDYALDAVEREVALGPEGRLADLRVVGLGRASGEPHVVGAQGGGGPDDPAHVEGALHVVQDQGEAPLRPSPPVAVEALHAGPVELLHGRWTSSSR